MAGLYDLAHDYKLAVERKRAVLTRIEELDKRREELAQKVQELRGILPDLNQQILSARVAVRESAREEEPAAETPAAMPTLPAVMSDAVRGSGGTGGGQPGPPVLDDP